MVNFPGFSEGVFVKMKRKVEEEEKCEDK